MGEDTGVRVALERVPSYHGLQPQIWPESQERWCLPCLPPTRRGSETCWRYGVEMTVIGEPPATACT